MPERRATSLVVSGVALVVTAPVLLALATSASAKTYEVTRTDDPIPGDCRAADCSLREAISAANARSGPDTVLLRGGRTYQEERSGADEIANATGDFNVAGALTIRPTGGGRAVIDANGLDRVFSVGVTEARFDHLEITGGSSTYGGGLVNLGGDVEIVACKIHGNQTSGGGGGVRNVDATASMLVSKSTISHNLAADSGGGIESSESLRIVHSTIAENESTEPGGGISVEFKPATLSHVRISGNESGDRGGGLYVVSSAATRLEDLTVTGNVAAAEGGGVLLESSANVLDAPMVLISTSAIAGNSAGGHGGGIYSRRRASITRSTISGNHSSSGGGGIAASDFTDFGIPGELTLANDTIANNTADGYGGGIDNFDGGEASLNNVTVAYNKADADGAVDGAGGGLQNANGQGATMSVANTIVAANRLGPGVDRTAFDCSGTYVSEGHNLIESAPGCDGFTGSGDRVGQLAVLGPLADNGGPTQTIALKRHSPAINNGGLDCEPGDQRGVKRHDCDTGAYERR